MAQVAEWSQENESHKQISVGRKVPDANEEYLIYQSLLGLWPADIQELPGICDRLQAYAVKATREAMVHTRWTAPNVPHEEAICGFIRAILTSE
jgi:(1->4)-alpha-D-glucan 1-alpha-D-glucosylmutase